MLRSMYSAISGLKTSQEKLDVIGNNIANVSTTGFKSQSVRFEDMVSQNASQATASNTNTGGVNGKQFGLGVQIASIDTLNTNGSMQPTSRPLDVAIDGAGYFMVGNGAVDAAGVTVLADHTIDVATPTTLNTSYTRDGGFELDEKGNLTTSNGSRVLGYAVGTSIAYDAAGVPTITFTDANAPVATAATAVDTKLVPLVIPDSITNAAGTASSKVQSYSIGKDGVIKAVLADGTTSILGQIAMASFNNEGGLKKIGSDQFQTTANSGAAVLRSGLGNTTLDNSSGYGDMNQGMLEMSNVDLAQQFTDMIVASRAFQANGKVITTGDDILNELIGLKR